MNIAGKRCVVCGGGEVALRKVQALLDCGASVEVISPLICAELADMAKTYKIRVHSRGYQDGDLQVACVVIAATDDRETNARIAGEAHRTGCIVNAVDDPDISDFIVPSCLKRGDITISVSTSGKSPALARKLRTSLERQFGPEYADLAKIVSEARTEIKKQGLKVDEKVWQESLDLELLINLIKEGKPTEAKEMIIKKITGGMD
ncbi:bifunctional precorrin-2 dehydrogenase/sirohydrochlorin ferrochelatase [Chloroflexota bacterium]